MEQLADRHALVTGAAGFIGANLVRALLARGCAVTAVVRASSALWRLDDVRERIRLVVADLTDARSLESLSPEATADVVIHAAAEGVAPGHEPDAVHESNVAATRNLAALLVDRSAPGRLVFLSSCSVYGPGTLVREDAPLRGSGGYARSKIDCEQLLMRHFRAEELRPVILRLYTPYGPWEAPHRLVTATLLRALRDQDISLTPGEQSRDLIHIDDATDAIAAAAVVPGIDGETLNVCTGVRTTVRCAVETIISEVGSSSRPLFGAYPYRQDETFEMTGDPSRMYSRLGVGPARSFAEGVRAAADWLKSHSAIYDTALT